MIQFDEELTRLYLRALLAIARADREIDAAEGERLDTVVKKRFPQASIAELMFEPMLRTDQLLTGLGAEVEGGPFRNFKVDHHEVARMFVEDALEIVAAKDGMSSAEEAALLRYAPIFGMPLHDVKAALSALHTTRTRR